MNQDGNGLKLGFKCKLTMATEMITQIAESFPKTRILTITDSWFGTDGLWKPLNQKLGIWVNMLSRLRSNNTLFELPGPHLIGSPGRPRKYGKKLGSASSLAVRDSDRWQRNIAYNLYGRNRTVIAYDRVVMLKTIRCAAKVVWIYRQTQWVALYSTDLLLSVPQVIEYYGARWKIEALFKELKRDTGSADTQTRNPLAVSNHLNFCMMATSVAWIYASRLEKTPTRRHAVDGRRHFAFLA